MSWQLLAFVGVLLTGCGHLADYFLNDRERGKIQTALARHWKAVQNRDAGAVPSRIAFLTMDYIHRLLGKSVLSLRFLLLSLVLSVTFTVLALLVGRYLEDGGAIGIADSFEKTLSAMAPGGFFDLEYILPANYLFDLLTLVFTMFIMETILRYKNPLLSILLIALDVLVAGTLAFPSMVVIKINTVLHDSRIGVTDGGELLREAISRSAKSFSDYFGGHYADYDALFYSMTSLIPTGFYLFILLCLFLVAVIDRLYSTRLAKRLLRDSAKNPDKTIFSRLGYLFTFLALLLSSLTAVLRP